MDEEEQSENSFLLRSDAPGVFLRQIGDSIIERYKQAARTGLLSEVLQEGAAVFGALLIKCPLPVRQ